MASDILDAFLNTPGVSPLGGVDFSASQLTRIPHQIKYFSQLNYLNLAFNSLQSIETDDFSGTQKTLKNLWFQNNQIDTIAPFAFKSESYYRIGLFWNNLTRFESTVFKSVLEKIVTAGGDPLSYIDLGGKV
jgi:Leucine-rich repeat (LRR) protein